MRPVRLAWLLLSTLFLMGFPFVFGSGGGTSLLEQIFVFGAFAMSYDLLIGYTGIVSFGHAMFFGTGAYAVAIVLSKTGGSTVGLLLGFLIAMTISILLSLVVAFLSLRVRHTYFAMVTLAVGQVFFVLAGSQPLRPLTNANDGISVLTPVWLNSNLAVYYFILIFLAIVTLFLHRFIHSPFGEVLRALRENESRAKALGYRIFHYKTLAFLLSGLIATLAGGMYVVVESFVSTSVYDIGSVSLQVVLMTIVGGVGTLYGGLIGAGIILWLQNELANLAGSYPVFNHAEIAFGVLYVLVVRFLPNGILGTLKGRKGRWRWTSQTFKKSQT
ncbi:branched-chain amino acid ABC transporter permease [Sulfoacidibacillus thermotolerans]|uniref:Branched-chain amino acid ABC transporter permease n=1 Tax=Sulfoacidibacillus thermotolerans TaxID=1765684 RepID=A0A2U3D8H2_SULT2|nr:branched-chain amino acid ABC transporter permease [Sulfoacidibacillus thermotolerans]PWI57559.1 hypothetical protein BM613_08035 [Sulfoacidibacillus thermotolerans]